MRKTLPIFVSAVIAIALLSSCLSDEDNTYTYYNDTAITSFSLGTLNRYVPSKTTAGKDTIVKSTYNCSGYSFNIDQKSGLIWNEDSLPTYIDASKVLVKTSAKNSGSIVIKSLTDETITALTSTDSIDFSVPRTLYVYNTTGTARREYVVKIGVHKEEADSFVWTNVLSSNLSIAALTEMKAVSNGKNIFLFGNAGTSLKIYAAPVNDGRVWNEVIPNTALSTEAVKSVLVRNGVIFTFSNGKVLSSDDAKTWTECGTVDLKQLVAASKVRLYALSVDNKLMSSSDNGTTWEEEILDDDVSLLPTQDISFTSRTMATNAGAEKIILIGNRSATAFADDTTAVVWTKIDESVSGSRSNSWNFVEFTSYSKYKAPRMTNWQLVNYDGNRLKAVGGNCVGKSSVEGLSRIYNSSDDGLTWCNDSVMTIPAGLDKTETVFTLVSDGVDSIWLIAGKSGQVWKGRINRLAWREEQDVFFE